MLPVTEFCMSIIVFGLFVSLGLGLVVVLFHDAD